MSTTNEMESKKQMIDDIKSIEDYVDVINKNYDKRNGEISFNSRLYNIENLISEFIKINEKSNCNPLSRKYATDKDVSRIEQSLEGLILHILSVYKTFSNKSIEEILDSMKNWAYMYASISELNETQMEEFWNRAYPSKPYAEAKKKFTKVK